MNLTIIISCVSIGLYIFMFVYLKWYVKQRTSDTGVLKETRAEVRNMLNQVNLSLIEINGATDRNLQLIEDKLIKLKEIMEDTDKRISVYVKEVEKSKNSEALYTQLGRGVRAALKTETETPLGLYSPPKPMPVPVTLPPAPVINDSLFNDNDVKTEAIPEKKKQKTSIDDLISEGLSVKEIASRLKISVAEAELAMQLKKR